MYGGLVTDYLTLPIRFPGTTYVGDDAPIFVSIFPNALTNYCWLLPQTTATQPAWYGSAEALDLHGGSLPLYWVLNAQGGLANIAKACNYRGGQFSRALI
jgi:hypothetical protein